MVKLPTSALFLLLIIYGVLFPQSSKDLEKIQQEIHQLKKELSDTKSRLQATIQLVQSYDRQIQMLNQSIRTLEKSIRQESARLDSIRTEEQKNEQTVRHLKNALKNQTLLIYIKGLPRADVDFIRYLQIQESYHYQKYVQFLLNYELQVIRSYQSVLAEQKELDRQQSEAVQNLKQLQDQQLHRKNELLASKMEQEQLLSSIRNDRKYKEALLKEKQQSYDKLKSMLLTLVEKKKSDSSLPSLKNNTDWQALKGKFSSLKGKLGWPVNGKVVAGFGKIVKEEHGKVVLPNKGIDIQTEKGEKVRAIHDGVVLKVSFIGAWGNTIIIDHNDGFYSIYCNLEDYFVSEGEYVKSGQEIGVVGRSLDGNVLHLEIWANEQPLNPQQWLRRN